MLLWFYCSYDIEATEFYLDTIILLVIVIILANSIILLLI